MARLMKNVFERGIKSNAAMAIEEIANEQASHERRARECTRYKVVPIVVARERLKAKLANDGVLACA